MGYVCAGTGKEPRKKKELSMTPRAIETRKRRAERKEKAAHVEEVYKENQILKAQLERAQGAVRALKWQNDKWNDFYQVESQKKIIGVTPKNQNYDPQNDPEYKALSKAESQEIYAAVRKYLPAQLWSLFYKRMRYDIEAEIHDEEKAIEARRKEIEKELGNLQQGEAIIHVSRFNPFIHVWSRNGPLNETLRNRSTKFPMKYWLKEEKVFEYNNMFGKQKRKLCHWVMTRDRIHFRKMMSEEERAKFLAAIGYDAEFASDKSPYTNDRDKYVLSWMDEKVEELDHQRTSPTQAQYDEIWKNALNLNDAYRETRNWEEY